MYKITLKKKWIAFVVAITGFLIWWMEHNHYSTESIVIVFLVIAIVTILLPVLIMVLFLRNDLDQTEKLKNIDFDKDEVF